MKRLAPFALAGTIVLASCADNTSSSVPTAPLTRGGRWSNLTAPEYVAGQIIVRYRDGVSPEDVLARHGGEKMADMQLERTDLVAVSAGTELTLANQLETDPDVEFAQPDLIYRVAPCEVSATCELPDGQFFVLKWDLHNPGIFTAPPQLGNVPVTTGLFDADIDWAELYDYLGPTFSGSATIGIMDTGIRPTHAMFVDKVVAGRRFLPDTLTIAGGTGNFIDDHGHGSHVAGIAAGRSTSAAAGVAYGANVKLVIGKVCNAAGQCPTSSTANGIVWAVNNGANVINLSLGSYGGVPDGAGSPAQQAALQYALANNVLPVCATGNDHGRAPPAGFPPYTGGIGYPARFPECMAVGASDWSDTKASYSNFGPQIAVAAPGGDGEQQPFSLIISASRNADASYAFNAGTSMATPEVAGAAAMLYATGYTSAAAVRERLIQTADDIEAPGFDDRTGSGRINVYRAVTGLSPNEPPVADPGVGYAGNKGVALQFDGSASNDPNGKPITFAWDFGDAAAPDNTSTLSQPTHTYMRAGNYTVTLTVADASGLIGSATRTAVIPNIVPAIATLPNATLLQGETYTASGSFADADPDAWSAAVTYGDGSAGETLALSAEKGFSLSHRYMAAGAKTVTVAVSDNDGGTGSGTATVTVLTPQQGIVMLFDQVIATKLPDPDGSIKAIVNMLRSALGNISDRKLKAAVPILGSFTKLVDVAVKKKRIPAATGAEWNALANRIIASINRT